MQATSVVEVKARHVGIGFLSKGGTSPVSILALRDDAELPGDTVAWSERSGSVSTRVIAPAQYE
jgi:hypothetical protein